MLSSLGPIAPLALAAGAMSPEWQGLKKSLRQAVRDDPMDAAVITVLGGAYLFYIAEKDHNDKVKTYWDALVFISTCLNVGYADVFARTSTGKAIASAVMTFGPALVGQFFEEPGGEKAETDPKLLEMQEKIATTLDKILVELRK